MLLTPAAHCQRQMLYWDGIILGTDPRLVLELSGPCRASLGQLVAEDWLEQFCGGALFKYH